MKILICVSIFLCWVSFSCLLFVFWQYITGRPYWGAEKSSFVYPAILCGIIPIMNIVGVALMLVVVTSIWFWERIENIRNEAIRKRLNEARQKQRKRHRVQCPPKKTNYDNGYGVVTEHDLD